MTVPIWLGLVSPFAAMGAMFLIIRWTGRRQRELRPFRRLPPQWPLLVGMSLVLLSFMPFFAASGQADRNRVKAECAKHGMAPFRVAFGHSRCIDKGGELRAFDDVR